jgi:hypothetical protein
LLLHALCSSKKACSTHFINSIHWVKVIENTNPHIEFLLQIQKQQEDLAMLLASNKQQHEETTKKQKDTTGKTKHKEKDSWEEQNQVGLQQAAHLQDYIQNHLENFKR